MHLASLTMYIYLFLQDAILFFAEWDAYYFAFSIREAQKNYTDAVTKIKNSMKQVVF
jgi:hypothetical protein